MFCKNSIKMIVCDMAGTIIQENGIVYNSLYHTIRLINPNLKREDINKFHGCSKKEVIDFFVDKERMNSPEVVKSNLNSEFNYFLKKEYSINRTVKLIDNNPLKPSIKFAPLITNRKQSRTKIAEKKLFLKK